MEKPELWVYLPLDKSSLQEIVRLQTSHPFVRVNDEDGNACLKFEWDQFAPYESKTIHISVDLNTTKQHVTGDKLLVGNYLIDHELLGIDDPSVKRLAEKLKGETQKETVTNIYTWVANNIEYAGYIEDDRGALYALSHGKGDCTEYAYLFTALARANGIPARVIGGYMYEGDSLIRAKDYHNWAEYFMDNAWHTVDPQRRIFGSGGEHYLAVRIHNENQNTLKGNFNRYMLIGEGLVAKMR